MCVYLLHFSLHLIAVARWEVREHAVTTDALPVERVVLKMAHGQQQLLY